MDRFHSPDRVFAAPHGEIAAVEGVSERLAAAIKSQPLTDAVKKELALVDRSDYSIVTMNDPGYPELLNQIPDPPPFLYVYGTVGDCSRNIAVVGARNATAYGRYTAEKLCREMAAAGITIVSGLARGIDTAAHRGALAARRQDHRRSGHRAGTDLSGGKPGSGSPDCGNPARSSPNFP